MKVDTLPLLDFYKEFGLDSKSQLKRLISQNRIKIDGLVIKNLDYYFDERKRYHVWIGKKRFFELVLEGSSGFIEKNSVTQLFDTLTASGIKKKGCEFASWFKTQKEAEIAYQKQLSEYAGDDIIIWRHKPEILKTEFGYNIYSRLMKK